ncbi:MAG TPA: GNAT family N-acetyltransferase [Pyrinomonadaceae bacterium]|nr:GNAT family N-acetyltransferase [Pyrinomonadaceae bacterium]
MTDDGLRLVSAADVSLAEFASAFTAGFEGYPHPVVLDGPRLARLVRLDNYDLENSLVAYEGGEAVGVAVLAVRASAGWVPALGVASHRRGRGLGRRMMSALLERARAAGLRSLKLEVIVRNLTARRIYEELGMRVTRDLVLLDRTAESAVPRTNPPRRRTLKEAEPSELLAHFARLHAAAPQWSRDLPSLLLKGGLRGLYFGTRARPRAYALLSVGTDGITYLTDLAAGSAEDARELTAALARRAEGQLRILNEPEESLFIAPLLDNGFVETDRQHEMLLVL